MSFGDVPMSIWCGFCSVFVLQEVEFMALLRVLCSSILDSAVSFEVANPILELGKV